MDCEKIKQQLATILKKERYQHCLSTAETAQQLAGHWHLDQQKAYLAGLLHDAARRFNDDELLDLALAQQLQVDPWTLDHPGMLHGPVGAALLESDWGITDEQIAEAIRYHTVPSANMGALAKIVFLADKIEPGRKPWPAQQAIRQLAYENLDQAIVICLEENCKYLAGASESIDPKTQEILEQYRNKIL